MQNKNTNKIDKKVTALIILDGFGYRKDKDHNAILAAEPRNFESWLKLYPNTILQASGKAVGLLDGMMGNSEVGHLTIGAGRIIKQAVTKLIEEINSGKFYKNPELIKLFDDFSKTGKTLHLMGLLSDAGVHSHEMVLYALIKMACEHKIKNIIVHAFLDGRDTPPKSASKYLENLDKVFKETGCGKLGSIHGRFYAMDRDKNWERTERSYDVLTGAEGRANKNNSQEESAQKKDSIPLALNSPTGHIEGYAGWEQALDYYYSQNITDEFIPPTRLIENCEIKSGDALIFFNIRADRARQLTRALIDPNFKEFKTKKIDFAFVVTGIIYQQDLETIPLVKKNIVPETFFDILEQNNICMFAIAETEKYAHVTYFFNGGQEKVRTCETRILIPSIPKKQYINLPQMSAPAITDTVLNSLDKDPQDFYLINYANADMVGHSGNFEATVKAIKILDLELEKLYKKIVLELNGTIYLTGDHGNAEYMWDKETNQPRTSHNTDPVYFLVLNKNLENKKIDLNNLHELSDIAPYILKQMGLEVPDVMKK